MRKVIFPSKDVSIYEAAPDRNAGLDEILEVGKQRVSELVSFASSSVRSLLAFDHELLAALPTGSRVELVLRAATVDHVNRNQRIDVVSVASPWEEGSGYFYQDKKNVQDGATWSDAARNTPWQQAGGDVAVAPTASVVLSTFPFDVVRIDITDIAQSSDMSTGVMLRFPSVDEVDVTNEGCIKFFGVQTHTIHAPRLEILLDDQVFVTGSSLLPIPDLGVKITPVAVAETYRQGDVVRVPISVRDPFPPKVFDATPRYGNKYYLPQTTYFSIIDDVTKAEVIPPDVYSAVSCDGDASYFLLDTSGLSRGRFYRVVLVVEYGTQRRSVTTDTMFQLT